MNSQELENLIRKEAVKLVQAASKEKWHNMLNAVLLDRKDQAYRFCGNMGREKEFQLNKDCELLYEIYKADLERYIKESEELKTLID